MAEGVVYIHEQDESGRGDDDFYLGTFAVEHSVPGVGPAAVAEGLSLEEALEWGRARADRIYVQCEGGIYTAGVNPSGDPAWPPPDLPELVRRRPAAERWKDRTEDDEPISWSVAVMLEPDRKVAADRVGEIARMAGADGWDADELRAYEAGLAPPRLGFGGWTSYSSLHRPAYRLRFTESAPTHALASEQALRRFAVPEGWTADATAEPA